MIIDTIVEQLIDLQARRDRQEIMLSMDEMNLLQSKGVEWFHLLLAFDTSLSRQYPPLKQLLIKQLQELGNWFIKSNPNETNSLLRFLLNDQTRIPCLVNCFAPSNQLVCQFQLIMQPSNTL